MLLIIGNLQNHFVWQIFVYLFRSYTFSWYATTSKSSTTLSWIVGPDISRTIINGNDLVTEEMLKNVSIGNSFLDNNVDIGILEEYCHSQAYKILLNLIHKKSKQPHWKCGQRRKKLINKRSIICEKCFKWYHFQCIALKEKPPGDLFCHRCIEFSKESKCLNCCVLNLVKNLQITRLNFFIVFKTRSIQNKAL